MTIDYRNNAQERVKVAIQHPDPTQALIVAQIATAEAVLALVEHQHIANLIALFQLPDDDAEDFTVIGIDYLDAAYQIKKGLGL